MYGLIGEVKMLKKVRDGLLVETGSNPQSKRLLKVERFGEIPVEVVPHNTLNTSKGVIYCRDFLNCSLVEIEENLLDKGVINVKRIQTRREGKVVDTPNLILTFNTPKLPKFINAAMYRLEVRPYIPAPLRCSRCLLFGHTVHNCSNNAKCNCGRDIHEGEPCEQPYSCVNCQGPHLTKDRKCPILIQELAIQKVKTLEKLSYMEAKRKVVVKTPTPAVSYAQSVQSTATTLEANIIKGIIPQLTQVLSSLINDTVKKCISSNLPPNAPSTSTQHKTNTQSLTMFPKPTKEPVTRTKTVYKSDSSQREKRKANNSPDDLTDDSDTGLSSSQSSQRKPTKRKPGWPKGKPRKTVSNEEQQSEMEIVIDPS